MLGSDRSNGGVVGRGGGCRIAWPTARGVIAIVASRSASAATLTERFPMPGFSSPSSEAGCEGRSAHPRSEERRVGKECRSRGAPYHEKKKQRNNRTICV